MVAATAAAAAFFFQHFFLFVLELREKRSNAEVIIFCLLALLCCYDRRFTGGGWGHIIGSVTATKNCRQEDGKEIRAGNKSSWLPEYRCPHFSTGLSSALSYMRVVTSLNPIRQLQLLHYRDNTQPAADSGHEPKPNAVTVLLPTRAGFEEGPRRVDTRVRPSQRIGPDDTGNSCPVMSAER